MDQPTTFPNGDCCRGLMMKKGDRMKTYPITPKEVGRKGDLVTIKYSDGKLHRVRGPVPHSSELIEIDLGDILNRENVESARRPYQPGDWRAA